MKHSRLHLFECPIDAGLLLPEGTPVSFALPPAEPLNLETTFRCGQIFRWHAAGDTWYGPYRTGSLAVRRTLSEIQVRALGVSVTAGEIWRFLGMHRSLIDIYTRLSHDRWVGSAIRAAPGMRLLRQDPWDCIAGYICSQNSNIPKIELSMERIARRCGTVIQWPEGVEVAAFPRPEVLAQVKHEVLWECSLGYRCKYLLGTARRVVEGAFDPEALRGLDYDAALAELLTLPGVGRKVADCILLFALDQEHAIPVDVWVRRIIHELYPRPLARYLPDARDRLEKALTAKEYDAIVRFARDRWGHLAGYAQQYLFHTRRTGLLFTVDAEEGTFDADGEQSEP